MAGESRGKAVRLTEAGRAAQLANTARLADIEAAWRGGFGSDAFDGLRTSLEGIVEPDAERSPLFHGLVPDPNGWRAPVGRPTTLPIYPMVLHRGGYPDGS
jgi:hypothetical protein